MTFGKYVEPISIVALNDKNEPITVELRLFLIAMPGKESAGKMH
jgi:hypothetical protein